MILVTDDGLILWWLKKCTSSLLPKYSILCTWNRVQCEKHQIKIYSIFQNITLLHLWPLLASLLDIAGEELCQWAPRRERESTWQWAGGCGCTKEARADERQTRWQQDPKTWWNVREGGRGKTPHLFEGKVRFFWNRRHLTWAPKTGRLWQAQIKGTSISQS